jgi:signal transduction histidine kinase
MSKRFVFARLPFIESSRLTSGALYGLTAFVVIFLPDLIWHFAGWNWSWARLASDAVEAVILALIASHLSQLREERILRRQRQMGYLNHHIRNSLSVIQLAEQALHDTNERANAIRSATRRICTVLEELTRNEDVSIDENRPSEIRKAG